MKLTGRDYDRLASTGGSLSKISSAGFLKRNGTGSSKYCCCVNE